MLMSLFRPLIERVKALLALSAAQELQAEALARQAERKAELLRKADDYESEGLADLAEQLRLQAGQLDNPQPLAGIQQSVDLLLTGAEPQTPALAAPARSQTQPVASGRKPR